MKKNLDLEIENMRFKDKIRALEDKLEEKTDDLKIAREKMADLQRQLEKNHAERIHPMIHSNSLNVSLFSLRKKIQIRVVLCI